MSDAAPILLVVHREWSRPGQIEAALNAKGWPTERCCIPAGDSLPDHLDGHAGVVIFGGPMSANDDHLEFIRAELDWIPKVVESGTPFFGVCLGGQMLARCLGGKVERHPDGLYEVGYYPISPTPEANGLFDDLNQVFHWHGEGFEVPDCAELLVTGEIFPNQAFRRNSKTYGIQFHPEMQEETLKLWGEEAWDKRAWPGGHPIPTFIASSTPDTAAPCIAGSTALSTSGWPNPRNARHGVLFKSPHAQKYAKTVVALGFSA